METKKQSFVKGAVILAAAGIMVKILGAIFKIPLARVIGEESMGYYQSAYEWYILALTISTYSIPIAVSRLVSEKMELGRKKEAHNVFKISLGLMTVLGAVISGILFFRTEIIVGGIDNPGSFLAVHYIIPSVLFVSISGAFRGYFQGMQNMTPSAASQIIEQIGRVFFGFLFAFMLLPKGPEVVAGGAAFGTTLGGVLSVVLLFYIYIRKRKEVSYEGIIVKQVHSEPSSSILKRIIVISIPIAIGGSIMPIMGLMDQYIVFERMQAAGYTSKAVASLYGQLKGMVASVVFMPSVFSISLGASLVPAISESIARKDIDSIRKKTDLGIRVSMIIGLPAACGLFILAEPIMRLLYKTNSENLGMLTRYMAPAIVVLTLVQTLTAILQGMGKERIPVKNLAIGAVIKLFLSYYLVSIPYINIKGVAIATIIGYTIPAVMNLMAIVKYQKKNFDYVKIFIKPMLASAAMTVTAYFAYKAVYSVILKNSIAVLSAIVLASAVYGVALIALRGITMEELQFAPGSNKLAKALKRRGVK